MLMACRSCIPIRVNLNSKPYKILKLLLDSLFLGLTKPIQEMAKPGHEEIWKKIYPTVFCADETDPDLKREPGLLKVGHSKIGNHSYNKLLFQTEFSTTNGGCIALSPKCYSLLCRDTETVKRGLKGVHTKTEISHQAFEEALYGNHTHKVKQSRFQYNSKNGKLNMISQSKIALNSLLTKLRVCEDNVLLEPLSKNGDYL